MFAGADFSAIQIQAIASWKQPFAHVLPSERENANAKASAPISVTMKTAITALEAGRDIRELAQRFKVSPTAQARLLVGKSNAILN